MHKKTSVCLISWRKGRHIVWKQRGPTAQWRDVVSQKKGTVSWYDVGAHRHSTHNSARNRYEHSDCLGMHRKVCLSVCLSVLLGALRAERLSRLASHTASRQQCHEYLSIVRMLLGYNMLRNEAAIGALRDEEQALLRRPLPSQCQTPT